MSFARGDILLVALVFSNQAGTKRRPVMVVSTEAMTTCSWPR